MREKITRYIGILKRVSRKALYPAKRPRLIVLLYHRIKEKGEGCSLIPGLINASPAEFEKEIVFLKGHFNIISAYEAVDFLRRGNMFSENSLAITFDDGYKDNYINAFPVLKKHRIPATIFLTTDFIGSDNSLIWTDRVAGTIDRTEKASVCIGGYGRYRLKTAAGKKKAKDRIIEHLKAISDREKDNVIGLLERELGVIPGRGIPGLYLSRKDILEMDRSGITFGSHGCSHAIMTRMAPEDAGREALESKRKIEDITGKETLLFSYPNGTSADFDERTAGLLEEAGYRASFSAVPGSIGPADKRSMFSLKRISAGRSFAELRKNIFLYA